MSKLKDPKRKPQQKKPLKDAWLVVISNGNGLPVMGTIEVLGLERSTIKTLKGGYIVVDNEDIQIWRLK